MARTDRYRQQHNELLQIATNISNELNASKLSTNASDVRRQLSTLLGKLSIHLAMEDKSFYPQLLKSTDNQTKEMANRFMKEMGGISAAVTQYSEKWKTPQTIQNDANTFIRETKSLFNALAARIKKENDQLYNLVDSI